MKETLLKEKKTFNLEIPADENNLSEVRDFIADVCRQAGFSKRETNNTKLAMDEACTNIIKHAYKDSAGSIRIEVNAYPGNIEVNIFDKGKTFEWSNIKDPDLQRYVEIGKKGGLGIYLMNRLMDDLDYSSSPDGNRLYMAKRSEGSAALTHAPLFTSIKPRWTATLRFKFALRAGMGLFGLILFLGIVQYVNQTRDVEAQKRQAWTAMRDLARTLESKSESAMVLEDLYDPKYREINDFIQDRIVKMPEILYVRIVNGDGVVVSSSVLEEFQQIYGMTAEKNEIPNTGRWFSSTDSTGRSVEEFHYPVEISNRESVKTISLGRVILGVSTAAINDRVSDPRLKTILILTGIFIVGLALIYLLISVFVKPIQDLTDGVRAIGEGALVDGIHIDGPEEIGAIASAFNEITAKFRDAQKNVVEQERLQKEMQVAQEIQHSLLPGKVPQISGYDIASLYRAAKEVGGDYYDFVSVGDDSLGVVVADVSGKGVPGSLVMTMIRTALRMEARGSLSAAEVMSRMNDFVTEDMKKGMFVTIFYLILDSKNRIISYASAGHNPMILYRAETDETFFLNPRGFPVGISLPDDTLFRRSIDVEKIKLKKDDMLVIYTDGVTEAMNEARQQYGEDRLIEIIKKNGRLTPEQFIDKLNEDIKVFTGDYPQNDDITVVAIKEKLMADDVLFGIRKKLLDLVEIEGQSVAEACQLMNVSPSTYYRYKKRLAELGDRGLKNKTLRQEDEIRRVSIEQRKELLAIIKNNPKLGAKRLTAVFNEGRDDRNRLSQSLVYDELKRMRLNTYEKRLEYLRRNRFISEEEYQELLAAPQARVPAGTADDSGAGGQDLDLAGVAGDAGVDELLEKAVSGAGETGAGIEAPEPGGQFEPVADEMEPAAGFVDRGAAASKSGLKPPSDGEHGELGRIMDDILNAGEIEGGIGRIESVEYPGGVIVLRIAGHLDSSSAADLENILESVYEYGVRKIIVDLGDVSYISSGGWGIFTGRVKSLREGEGDVVLAGMSPEVFDIYELLGFRDIIMHFQKVDEAIEFISLPFETRRRKLDEINRIRAREKVLEHRVKVEDSPDAEEDEKLPWTPLAIEAGTVGGDGEITVLSLAGVIDTVSCMKLREVMDGLIDGGKVKLVVDMSRVEYVSSAGWGVFASRMDEVRSKGGDIRIFGMDPEVDNIFHLLGFDVIMRSFSIMAEAIEDFPADAAPAPMMADSGRDQAPPPSRKRGEAPPVKDAPQAASALTLVAERRMVSGKVAMIILLGGAVDAATTEQFEIAFEECVAEKPELLIVDLSDIVYISSSGWGVIIKYMQRMTDLSGRIALSGMSPAILRIFRDLGFEPLIRHYLTAERALAEISSPSLGEYGSVEGANTPSSARATVEEGGPEAPAEAEETSGGGEEPSRGPDLAGPVEMPSVTMSGVSPLVDTPLEKADHVEVAFDLENRRESVERKDVRIRRMGWKEYGKKLAVKNRTDKGQKNGEDGD
ncbi:MAG: anti-sigma factor antagonist [Candidatus Krumholzibacteria bacterium]|nr:anti-sigma factor antagonist [Candidatus Krumholzibacteria bacterium]